MRKIILHVKETKDFNQVLKFVKKAMHEYCVEPYLDKIEPENSNYSFEGCINAFNVIYNTLKIPGWFKSLSENEIKAFNDHPLSREIHGILDQLGISSYQVLPLAKVKKTEGNKQNE
ncbi:MAG: hypothetical protein ACFFCS_27520 [Candidatus Hodarchaeota archaeon]